MELEGAHGLAVCDTDPAKLYYAYALRQTGRLDEAAWRAECGQTRDAFAAGDLGLPDLVFFAERDIETLERHRAADPTRRRHRFRMHVELQPWLARWWQAVDAVEPGRVFWRHPDSLEELLDYQPRVRRIGGDLLDEVLANLTVTGDS